MISTLISPLVTLDNYPVNSTYLLSKMLLALQTQCQRRILFPRTFRSWWIVTGYSHKAIERIGRWYYYDIVYMKKRSVNSPRAIQAKLALFLPGPPKRTLKVLLFTWVFKENYQSMWRRICWQYLYHTIYQFMDGITEPRYPTLFICKHWSILLCVSWYIATIRWEFYDWWYTIQNQFPFSNII